MAGSYDKQPPEPADPNAVRLRTASHTTGKRRFPRRPVAMSDDRGCVAGRKTRSNPWTRKIAPRPPDRMSADRKPLVNFQEEFRTGQTPVHYHKQGCRDVITRSGASQCLGSGRLTQKSRPDKALRLEPPGSGVIVHPMSRRIPGPVKSWRPDRQSSENPAYPESSLRGFWRSWRKFQSGGAETGLPGKSVGWG